MKILVTGAHGLLGTEVVSAAQGRGWGVVALGRGDLDVTDSAACVREIQEESPDWVVHCAAYTAVDRAEEEPELALRVNRDGAKNVAEAAGLVGVRMAYISSDYVFDGAKGEPYGVDDDVRPLSSYANSKLQGEVAATAAHPDGLLIVRTGWLYGAGGGNFVEAILRRAEAGAGLKVVNDQRGRPTWGRNVAHRVLDLIELEERGVWNVADGSTATWLEFAVEALRLRGLSVPIEGVSTEDWGAPAPRPKFSVLDLSATEERIGRQAQNWRDALASYLAERDELKAVRV